jgi:beta-lactamase superfamily II metal-dependent hydrolase
VRAQRLTSADDDPRRPRPHSVGAAVAPVTMLPKHVDEISRIPSGPASNAAVQGALSTIVQPASVLVRDVGQASFTTLLDDKGAAILHYDAGFPIAFNRHTFPKALDPSSFDKLKKKSVVVLSHWDWDHLHAAHSLPDLLESRWIVPSQRIGPGAARLARMLAAKKNLLVWPANLQLSFSGGMIMECTGSPASQNDTGLALYARLKNGKTALLTGDSDYKFLPAGCASQGPFSYLIATHHGARFKSLASAIPKPLQPECTLVVSYGTGNVYRHPHADALNLHFAAGWTKWISTAGRQSVAPRGDRSLQ